LQESSDDQEDVKPMQSDPDSYQTLLNKSRTENYSVLLDVKTLLRYDVHQQGKCSEKPFCIPEDVDWSKAWNPTACSDENFRQNTASTFRGPRHSDVGPRNRFKFQLLDKLNKLNKRGIGYRRNKVKRDMECDLSSTDCKLENNLVKIDDYYSSVFHGTTIDVLRWNTKKLETDILEEKQKQIIDELDLHSTEVDLLREDDHEIEKVKIRKKIRAKLDDNARKIFLKGKQIRHDLRTKGVLVKEQVKETWQKKKQRRMGGFFMKEVAGTENSGESGSTS